MRKADVAIIGGGLIGLTNEYEAARRGHSVVLFERNDRAQGASIRNFGMVWPIGQAAGPMLDMALRSRDLWRDFLEIANLPYSPTGSIHLTYRDDERQVAEEFSSLGPRHGYRCTWLSPEQVLARCPGADANGLLGGLWSETELTVDPRAVIAEMPKFLAERRDMPV